LDFQVRCYVIPDRNRFVFVQVQPFEGTCTEFTSVVANTLGKAQANRDTQTVSAFAAVFGRAVFAAILFPVLGSTKALEVIGLFVADSCNSHGKFRMRL
jgi:hypothetical protein